MRVGKGESTQLNQAEFVNMGKLSTDSEINVAAYGVKKSINSLFVWLE